jgi:SAM dependent carboxyl methyltransferase
MPMEPMLETYNANSALQATCQSIGNPILEGMAIDYRERTANQNLKLLRIADYGCSGGRNSYEPMRTIISTLGRSSGLSAECVLGDLPSNPWHQVMEEGARLTHKFNGNVHCLCAGTSFYNQVCGDETVDLAYSYVAAHFLSRSWPMNSHVLLHECAPEERKNWQVQAAQDWERFLFLRARELKRGGKIMLSTMSRDDSGYSWKEFSNLIWDSVNTVRSRGGLSQQEVESLCIPASLRSEGEIMAPFASGSEVSSVFTVDSLEFARTEVEEERHRPTSVLVPLIRRRVESVCGGMFLVQLRKCGRSSSAAISTMQEVWNLFEEKLPQDPTRGWVDMRCFYLQLTRI